MGSEPDEEFTGELIDVICKEQGIGPEFSFEGKLEMKDICFDDLLHGNRVSGNYEINGGDVSVLWREEKQEGLLSSENVL